MVWSGLLGEYIIFIDSDDYIEKDMLKKMYELAKKENSDLVICDYNEVYDDYTEVKRALPQYSKNNIINYMLSNASPWNKLIKTNILKQNDIRFLENHIYEDLATMPIVAGYLNKVSYLHEPLYNYIIRSGSTMRQIVYNKKLESIFVAIKHLETEFKKRNLFDKYSEEIEFLVIYHLLYAGIGRFLQYPEGKEKIKEIRKIIKNSYPNWESNKYYKKQSMKIKITCFIFYYNIFLNIYTRIKRIIKK